MIFTNGIGLWLLSFLIICIFFALIKYYFCSNFTRQGIPHHRSLFFYAKIGRQAHIVDETNSVYRKYCKSAKPFAGFYMLMQPIVVLLDLDVIRDVLIKDFNTFSHRRLYHNPRDDPLMGNLAVVDGAQWKKLRSRLTPSFTAAKMKYMFPIVVNVGKQLEKVVGDMIGENMEGNVVDIKELTACFTIDIIASITLGLECNSLSNPNHEFRLKIKKLFDSYKMSKDMFQQVFPKIARLCGCINTPKDVTKYFIDLVRESIEYRLRENIIRNDFLQLMLEMYCDKEQNETWSLEEIAAQVFIFILAGFETSATTVAFGLYELSLNPDIQEHVRSEIQQTLELNDGELTFDALKRMVYLEQVVYETLRMHPSAPALKRIAVEDYYLPGTKYHIKSGTNVIVPMEAIHYDERFYPSPERFDPKRFTPDNIKERHPMTYLPFGDGPRNCIGKRFGHMQTMIGLAMLLKSYRFRPAESTPIPILYDNTILLRAPRGKLELIVERIS